MKRLLPVFVLLCILGVDGGAYATSLDWRWGTANRTDNSKAGKTGSNKHLEFDGTTQKVFLDFDSQTNGPDHVYTAAERDAIKAKMEADYAAFNYSFHLTAPAAPFSTIVFNADGIIGGLAEQIDFLNLDHSDNAKVNVNSLLGGGGQPPATSANFIGLSATVGAHELGHLAGLRHGDAFGPLGSGIHDPPGVLPYTPEYPGPIGADETNVHISASPASTGQTLFQAVNADNMFFGEREAIKLEFNESGTIVAEQVAAHGTMATAQALALATINVPNTLLFGDHFGIPLSVDAIHVIPASIGVLGETDFYSFFGEGGDLLNLEVMSDALDLADPIDSTVTIFNSLGVMVPYYSSTAFNDDEFETLDSIIIDLRLPADGTYFVMVDVFDPTVDTGNYELFIYTFTPVPEPGTLGMLGIGAVGLLARRRRAVGGRGLL